jgi:hypothetical protein
VLCPEVGLDAKHVYKKIAGVVSCNKRIPFKMFESRRNEMLQAEVLTNEETQVFDGEILQGHCAEAMTVYDKTGSKFRLVPNFTV